jgi:hypothetical protein
MSSVIFKPAAAKNKSKFSALLSDEYHECITQFESFIQTIRDASLRDCIKQVNEHVGRDKAIIAIKGSDSKGMLGGIVEHYRSNGVCTVLLDAAMPLEQNMKTLFSTLLEMEMDGKGMRCSGSAYEFLRCSQKMHNEVVIGVQNAQQWDGRTWDRLIGILLRNIESRIALVLDSKIMTSVGMHLLSEQLTITTATPQILLGKLLCKLVRIGILIDGDLVKGLLTETAHSGVTFDACCTQLKVRMDLSMHSLPS